MLVRKPVMAPSVMSTLKARTQQGEIEMLEGSDSEQLSVSVLSLMNANLKPHVLAPFKTEATTINYAHQLVDFWNQDVRPKAGKVNVPVLLISSEYDQVATPAASTEAAKLFPIARHIHVKGATHYCLYDRPEFMAGLLKTFFANPADILVSRCAQDKVSHCVEAQPVGAGVSADMPAFSSGRSAYGS